MLVQAVAAGAKALTFCCLQKTESEQFLCELPVATSVVNATTQLVDLQNLRTRIHR